MNFCHGILSLPPFSPFWDIPFHCSLNVVWDGRGCSILVVKLSAGSRLTLSQSVSGHVVQTKILGKRRTRGTNQAQANMAEKSVEKVSYFLQRFLYGFKSTLQKGNAQLKKVLNWPQKRFNTWNFSCGVWETRQFFNVSYLLFVFSVLHVNSVSSLAAERQLPGPCEQVRLK